MNSGGPKDSNDDPSTTNQATLVTYTGTAPPPPAELYHRMGAVTKQTVAGASIYYYKIKYTKDLQTNKTPGQPVGKYFQVLYGK